MQWSDSFAKLAIERGHELITEELFEDLEFMSPEELKTAITKSLSYIRNTATWGHDKRYDAMSDEEEITIAASRAMPHIFFSSFLAKELWPRFMEIISDDLEAAEGDEDFVKAVNELSWFMLAVVAIPSQCSHNTYFYDVYRDSSRSLDSLSFIPLTSVEDTDRFNKEDGSLVRDRPETVRYTINKAYNSVEVLMLKSHYDLLLTMLDDRKGAWLMMVKRQDVMDTLQSPEILLDYIYNCDDAIIDISFTSELNDSNSRLLEQFLDV